MTTPVQLPRITGPNDLLAAVPYLLGFHPSDSLVILGLLGDRLTFAARVDLPAADDSPDDLVDYLTVVVARQRLQAAVLVGYGTEDRVKPVLLALWGALVVPVHEVLRVTGARFWSYVCDNPHCCGPSGRAFDPTSSPVAAAAAFAGVVAARVAPVGGTLRAAMHAATLIAERRLGGLGGNALAIRSAGRVAVRDAISRQRGGTPHSDEEVAWLTVLLRAEAVRDFAWQAITDPEPHVALWTDVVRRAEPELAAAPASLLAFAAWRHGDGALASVAVARALEADPSYSMALLVQDILYQGISPSSVDGWPRREADARPGPGTAPGPVAGGGAGAASGSASEAGAGAAGRRAARRGRRRGPTGGHARSSQPPQVVRA
jgi:hypothetical protein